MAFRDGEGSPSRGGAVRPMGRGLVTRPGRISRVVLWLSAAVYLTGIFVSYLLGPILWLES